MLHLLRVVFLRAPASDSVRFRGPYRLLRTAHRMADSNPFYIAKRRAKAAVRAGR